MRYKRSPKQYSNTVIVQQAELQNVNFFTQIISVQLILHRYNCHICDIMQLWSGLQYIKNKKGGTVSDLLPLGG